MICMLACNCFCIRFIAPEINPLPFFSPLTFSPLPDMLLLFVWCCLECHLVSHPLLCYVLMPVVIMFSFLHLMDIMTGLLIAAVIFPILFLFGLSCFPSASLCLCPSHPGLRSTCCVAEFVVRSFYLLYFTFRLGQ